MHVKYSPYHCVHNYFGCRGETVPGGQSLIHDMPQRLRANVSMEECGDLLRSIGLFEKAEDKFIQEVALTTSVYLFAPGDIILYRGDMGREMYCVQKGYVEVCSKQKKTLEKF